VWAYRATIGVRGIGKPPDDSAQSARLRVIEEKFGLSFGHLQYAKSERPTTLMTGTKASNSSTIY
jgi:hypothetical protein